MLARLCANEQIAAAKIIQRHVRGMITRNANTALLRQQQAAIARQHAAATTIQCAARQASARAVLRKLIAARHDRAATAMQTAVRGYLARLRMQRLLQKRLAADRRLAADLLHWFKSQVRLGLGTTTGLDMRNG